MSDTTRPHHRNTAPSKPALSGNSFLESRQTRDESVLAQALHDVEVALSHRLVQEDPQRIVPNEELPLVARILVDRVLAGILPREQILGFARGLVNGGAPLSYLRENSLDPLTIDDPSLFSEGQWLPSFLTERRIRLPDCEEPTNELNIQPQRIVRAIQETLVSVNPHLPIFFLGSAAANDKPCPFDIDIGTSRALRSYFMSPVETSYDTFAQTLIRRMSSGAPILGMKSHVGAVWEDMALALGVSVTRYGRAFRISPSSVFIVEARLPSIEGIKDSHFGDDSLD